MVLEIRVWGWGVVECSLPHRQERKFVFRVWRFSEQRLQVFQSKSFD